MSGVRYCRWPERANRRVINQSSFFIFLIPHFQSLLPLRILHISTRLILGGSQENTVLSCEGQARLGHRVHLAFGPIYGPEGSLLKRVEQFNHRCKTGEERTADGAAVCPIITHRVPHLVRDLSPIADVRCYYELRDLVQRLTPDVVHTHSSKAGIIGRCAAYRRASAAERALAARTPISYSNEGGGRGEGSNRGKAASSPDTPFDPTASARSFIGPAPYQFAVAAGCRVIHTIHGPPFMPIEGTFLRRLKTRITNAIYTIAERMR
jgi:hypothetical protein